MDALGEGCPTTFRHGQPSINKHSAGLKLGVSNRWPTICAKCSECLAAEIAVRLRWYLMAHSAIAGERSSRRLRWIQTQRFLTPVDFQDGVPPEVGQGHQCFGELLLREKCRRFLIGRQKRDPRGHAKDSLAFLCGFSTPSCVRSSIFVSSSSSAAVGRVPRASSSPGRSSRFPFPSQTPT